MAAENPLLARCGTSAVVLAVRGFGRAEQVALYGPAGFSPGYVGAYLGRIFVP